MPGSSTLYTVDEFAAAFTANAKETAAYKHVLSCTRGHVPPRPDVASAPARAISSAPTSLPTGFTTRFGRAVQAPLQPDAMPDKPERPAARRLVAPLPPAAAALLDPERRAWRMPSSDVTFIKSEQNPDHDIEPAPGIFQCFQLDRPGYDSRVLFYGPDGRLVGSTPLWKAEDLWHRFHCALQDPALCEKLNPTSFAQEICMLFTRYVNGERTDTSGL